MNLAIAAAVISMATMASGFTPVSTKYKDAIRNIWNTPPSLEEQDAESRLRTLVRYGTLAPSSHNTQCWRFVIDAGKNAITIFPDFSRRCPKVDPDDHHLYATLGCALENIVIAAKAHGLDATVDSSKPDKGISLSFTPCEPYNSPLFDAIPKRQCTRADYDGKPLKPEEMESLNISGDGVQIMFLTDEACINNALEFIVLANTAQFDNPEFVKELKHWVRFSKSEAVNTGDGLSGACVGSPAPSVPRWLGSRIFNMALSSSSENAKILQQVKSSAGIAIFASEKDDAKHWVEAGRCYERFALQATALGIRNAFLNMPVEEADIRPNFAASLGLPQGSRPDFVVRFGKGRVMPKSLRRPLESVIEYAN